MKKIYLYLFLIAAQPILAQQTPFFVSYDWEEKPHYEIADPAKDDVVEVKQKVVSEFIFDEEENFVEYALEHRVIWLNSDKEIEAHNRIYLPYTSTSVLEVSKARVVTKEGKILSMDESNIFTAEDEETGRQYKYFAFEGIEKGSFIEYYWVTKRYPQYQGKKVDLQSGITKRNVEFDLYAPEHLVFKFKSYNNLPEVILDTLVPGKLHWQLKLDEIPKLEEEELSAYDASRGFIVYKLDQNLYSNSRDLSSYSGVAQNIYNYYYPEYSRKENKKLESFLKEVVSQVKDEENKIRKLENFIKTNIYVADNNNEELKELENVLDKKVANETGIMKLYIAALRNMGIKHEVVLTSNRNHLKFDKEFEATNFLTDFLIYFPKYKTYLSPEDINSRYGFPPAYLTDNYGLFVKEVSVGDYTSGVGKIKFIEPIPAEKTFDKMLVNISFEEDIYKTTIQFDRSLHGYYAVYIQPFLNFIKDKDRDELLESLAERVHEDVEILEKRIVNDDPELFGIEPLAFELKFKTDKLVEKAGNKYLFKIGEVIGQQMQLYQEKERVLPLENEYQRSYYRSININIPEGYKIVNLDDLNINNVYSEDGKEIMSFKSFYEIEGNVVKITADEHYRKNIIETSIYEEYRKVINSAADFNKIVLVLEPK